MNKKTQEQVEKQAVRTVQSVLAGERIGFNNALHWAANWIESSAQANGSSAIMEFAKNMAMTFRANFRKKQSELKDEKGASHSAMLTEYHRKIGEIFLARSQTPYRICKQIWALHAEFERRLTLEDSRSNEEQHDVSTTN